MKTTNVTVFKCDLCGKEITCQNYEDIPISWFSYAYRSDKVRLDVDGMTIVVSFEDKHFCSSHCVCDFFAAQFMNSLSKEIAGVKTEGIEP